MHIMKAAKGLLPAVFITMMMACNDNANSKEQTKNADSLTSTATINTPTDSSNTSTTAASPAPTADCMIKATLGAREWKASGVTVNRVNEHLTISHDGDYTDSTDIHNMQIIINNYNGPGTYTFDGSGNVTFSFGFTQTDNYLTSSQSSTGSIIVTEHSKTSFKATFSFKASNTDGDGKTIEVINGEVSAKDGGNCRVQEYVNPS
ncbi:DUF6252 family protein [Pseudobacter ginsenosidimutans]|uniref:Lipoprotein n=1 Tax=Pseudobacter ginsenosidimutans TaxID=661488 RepID=A0A4Q7MUR8_9BACT|nr:hypothetical protein [Pseudobacter ginsenosidimutans]QEC40628.1 hypothetical protein FSB84_02550 [Pseudobacter ginsenosidimutans]RZS72652.1 hypothetical protein EV199_4575 [Pseudobacter ginsenosidimutans]